MSLERTFCMTANFGSSAGALGAVVSLVVEGEAEDDADAVSSGKEVVSVSDMVKKDDVLSVEKCIAVIVDCVKWSRIFLLCDN